MASPKGMVFNVGIYFSEAAFFAEIRLTLVNVVTDQLLGLSVLLLAAEMPVLVLGLYAMLYGFAVCAHFLCILTLKACSGHIVFTKGSVLQMVSPFFP